jgi:hypothetical protein
MKKLALILALVSLMALCVSSLTVNAAPPKLEDYFPQVAAPTEEEAIYPTTWDYKVGVDQLPDPTIGTWSWADTFQDKPGCWTQNDNVLPLDCNYKTYYWESRDVDFTDKGATHIRQVVFTDPFTQSGLGDYGRHNPTKKLEDFEQLTIIYSPDGQNWKTTKNFTVAFHTEKGSYTDYYKKEHPYDTYWHLILDEAIPVEQCKYMGYHSAEGKAWDAADHAYTLGSIISWKQLFLVKDTGVEPELTYPEAETTAAPTEAPATTVAPETDAATEGATNGVTEAPATNAPAGNAPAESNGIDAWVWIVIGVAVVAVVVVVVIVAKKKK